MEPKKPKKSKTTAKNKATAKNETTAENETTAKNEVIAEDEIPEELGDLTYLQYRALVCFMVGMTSAQAAAKCNVSKKTMDRVRGTEALQKSLTQAGIEIYKAALAELTLSATKAVRRIDSILDDETVTSRIHLTAADLALRHVDKLVNFELYDRMVATEKLLEKNQDTPPHEVNGIEDSNGKVKPTW